MTRQPFTTLRNLVLMITGIVLLQTAAFAGPPLICHPFRIGNAPSLPFQGPGWSAIDPSYDTSKLVDDTIALLTPSTPVIVRMETLRRATVYGRNDAKLAATLLERIKARAAAVEGRRDREALLERFDLGYLAETYKQAVRAAQYGNSFWSFKTMNPGIDGYALVEKALEDGGGSEMEFAAALIKADQKDASYEQHLRKAVEGAKPGTLLAENIAVHFPELKSRNLSAEARK